MKNQEIPQYLIYKFYRNQCTIEEHQKVLEWMKGASDSEISKLLDRHIGAVTQRDFEYNVETRLPFDKIAKNINEKKEPVRRKLIFRRSLQAAATILLLLTSYYSVHLFSNKPGKINVASSEAVYTEIKSAYGIQTSIKLNDGSEVKLNAGSTLTHPEIFSSGKRELALNGNAFFKVAKDTARPFIINVSDKFEITVLGTIFDVKSFSNENISTVTVLSGKVWVYIKNIDTGILLTADQQLVVDSRNNNYKKQTINAKESIAWINGILKFENSTLEDVFKQMERWYNVKIIVPDNLDLNCTVSGQHKNEGLETVLEALQYSLGFSFQYVDGSVVITKITCK